LDNHDVVIIRIIPVSANIDGTHTMFYSGCSGCMTPEWVDDPSAAIVFHDHDLASKTLRGVKAMDLSDFPISLKPVSYADEEE
jgi:hypothetical protein